MDNFYFKSNHLLICVLLCLELEVYCQDLKISDENESMVVAGLVLSLISTIGVVILSIIVACYFIFIRKGTSYKSRRASSRRHHSLLIEKASHLSELQIEGTELSTIPLESSNVCVGAGTLRQIALGLFEEVVLNLENVGLKIRHSKDKLRPQQVHSKSSFNESDSMQARVQKRLHLVFDGDTSKVDIFSNIAECILASTTVRQLLDATFRACRVARGVVKEWQVEHEHFVGTVPEDGNGYISFTVEEAVNKIKVTWDDQKFSPEFLDTVSLMLQALRDERRQPTPTEYLAIHLAYNFIGNGKQLTLKSHRPLGSPGFRPHTQTYMSLTDPGDGHVLGTTRFNDWMTGAIVHVEHLERHDNSSSGFPSLSDFSRVRLHVGSSAPTSYYVGRRVEDTRRFTDDFMTLTNMTSASVSAAFYQGAAECAVTMDGFTTSQAVAYMKELHRQVHRDPFSQILSASWKINQSLEDDFEVESKRTLTERLHVACRATEITSRGGFDKIIWDGRSEQSKTSSVLKQFSIEDIIFLVHEARSRGLVTQFIGNIELTDAKIGVYSGADAIGVGGSGTLRLPTSHTESNGPYREEMIPSVLKERNEASNSLMGRAAHLLARLDTMYFEGSISSTENGMRCQLFNAILNHDDRVVEGILDKMNYIMQMQCEYGLPLLGEARRLVESKSPLLKEVAGSFYEWVLFITRLKTLLEKNDVKGVMEDYDGEPWSTYRLKYLDSTRSHDQKSSKMETTQL